MFSAVIEKADFHDFQPRARYPFRSMRVGDSIRFEDFKRAESARVSALQFARRNCPDWKFAIRKSTRGWDIIRVE